MALFNSDTTGAKDDSVRIQLGGDDVLVAEDYEVTCGILEQPCSFSLRLGHSSVIASLMRKYPKRTPFTLFIGGIPRFTGVTSGRRVKGTASSGNSLTIHGYDALNELHRGMVRRERSFANESYKTLVQHALDEVGFTGTLLTTNIADRQLQAGVKLTELAPPQTLVDVQIDKDAVGARSDTHASQFQTKLGERWLDFIDRHIARAGLMLWATSTGDAVLSAPNGEQKPVAQIIRNWGELENDEISSVSEVDFNDDDTHRFSEYVVYGRTSDKEHGRSKHLGTYKDTEMTALGYKRLMVMRDADTQSDSQCSFLARRKAGERRREGWSLTYIVAGHTVPAIGSRSRAIWSRDTVVNIIDNDLEISGDFYLEKCVYRRQPHTTTELRFMRKEDLIFGGSSAT